jgi:inosose dehydratase
MFKIFHCKILDDIDHTIKVNWRSNHFVHTRAGTFRMNIGCFALVQPFSNMDRQFELIHEMGIEFADLTDNHNGGMLGVEYGFSASVSLDIHPAKIRQMLDKHGITLTSVCAHANLLDPPSPDIYSTNEIIKAIRLAHHLGVRQVITTEGDPKTEFGHHLTPEQRVFSICSKLQVPLQWAEELDIELLLEPHGIVTGSPDGMEVLLNQLGRSQKLGVCLDTGNSWLAGADPLEYIRCFGNRIKHIHWKDMGPEWVPRRGQLYGCGMSTIALGDGVIGITAICEALQKIGFDGDTTLEIAGRDHVMQSASRLREWLKKEPAIALEAASRRVH